MKKQTVKTLLQENINALKEAKGHNKATIRTCIALLNEMPHNMKIAVRHNTSTPTNAGDIAEIWAGLQLGFINKDSVSANGSKDLNQTYRNEVKLCYSNNRPSNDIEDKGHYMVYIQSGQPKMVFVPRAVVRANKDSLIKGRRGGSTYANNVLASL